MAITDELREFAASEASDYDDWVDGIAAIADRIDAAHERALRESYDCGYASADDWLAQHEDAMAEHGWIRLPLDADGVPIRVGDVMENTVHPPTHREVTGVGAECFYAWEDGCGRYSQFDAACYRHYHAPTVEDVLREFAEKVTDSQIPGVHPTYEEAIAEYAAKLRLDEEVDE